MGNLVSFLLMATALVFSILYYGGSDEPTFSAASVEHSSAPKKASTPISTKKPTKSTPDQEPRPIAMADRPQVLLFTGTSWCPACVRLQRNVLATPEWRKFVSSEIRFKVYNVASSSRNRTTAVNNLISKYGIQAYPTMVVVSKDGSKLTSIRGAKSSTKTYRDLILPYVGR